MTLPATDCGRSNCHIDWVMNGYRWSDLFYNLPDGTSHGEAIRQAEMRLPLLKRGYRTDEHSFDYQIVGTVDQPSGNHAYPFAEM